MNIVIVGGGKIGFSIAQELALENHDVIVVEKDPERAAFIEDTIDVVSVCGTGAVMDVQRRAGVPDADLMIAVTAGDELNQLACMIARKLGCQNTIARVRDREYSMQLHELKDELRLSMAINPEQLAAREIFKLLQFPAFMKRDTFAEGKAEIVELEVTEGSPLDGLRLMDMYNKIRVRALVCVVVRNGEAVNEQFVAVGVLRDGGGRVGNLVYINEFAIMVEARVAGFADYVEVCGEAALLGHADRGGDGQARALRQSLDVADDVGDGVVLHLVAADGR